MISEQDVQAIIKTPGKVVTKTFSWIIEASGHMPKNYIFESSLRVGSEVPEGLRVQVRYRDVKRVSRGAATIVLPESFSCALLLGEHRISALDTNPGQRHTNRVGAGLPYHGQTISTDTHRHLWVGVYGYAEPVEPALLDVVELLQTFARENNLIFQGALQHPLKGSQMGLGL